MPDQLAAGHMAFPVPDISQVDLYSFHEAHFSSDAIRLFEADFLQLQDSRPGLEDASDAWDAAHDYEDADYDYDEEDYDDGLGYYADGVKRTLTDEQIAMFRHSEVEALKRAEAKGASAAAARRPSPADDEDWEEGELAAWEGGSVASPAPEAGQQKQQESNIAGSGVGKGKSKKRKRGKGGKNGGSAHHQPLPQEPKVDLRKRTWDVVEKGFVGGLNYDETEGEQASAGRPAQRRHISYDDD